MLRTPSERLTSSTAGNGPNGPGVKSYGAVEPSPLVPTSAIPRPFLTQLFSSSTKRDKSPAPPPLGPPGTPQSTSTSTPTNRTHHDYDEDEDEGEDCSESDSGKNGGRFAVSLTLLNNGSAARDHLASERTFLAYLRTSLSISSAGVALTQFLKLTPSTKGFAGPLGATAIFTGIVVLIIGVKRFFDVQNALPKGYFPTNRLGIALIAFLVGTLIAVTFGVLLRARLSGS